MIKKMLITGAAGMVGKQAADYFSEKYRVTALTKADVSIVDKDALIRVFETVNPDIVLNCAVIRNDRCSQNIRLARDVNAQGVRNLAVQCRNTGAVLVQLSTDYVFEGNIGGGYTEETVPYPLSVYGKTKREGELFALEENEKTFVIRTGWLYGRCGDNFVHKILRQIWSGQEIDILRGQYGNPTSVDILLCMMRRLLDTTAYGIYHAVCSGRTSRVTFAEQIVRQIGDDLSIREISDSKKTVFDTSLSADKLYQATKYRPAHWTKVLESYLNEVKHENFIEFTERRLKD